LTANPKPPRTLDIGPHVYAVDVNAKRADDASVRYAQVNIPKLEIVVNPDQHASQMADSLLHEVLHAVMDLQGACVGEAPLVDPKAEEPLVRAMTPLVLDVLRRNPDFVAFLLHPTAKD
jgi:hypothetical protein